MIVVSEKVEYNCELSAVYSVLREDAVFRIVGEHVERICIFGDNVIFAKIRLFWGTFNLILKFV